jgi:ABC-2 type transport system permease protein
MSSLAVRAAAYAAVARTSLSDRLSWRADVFLGICMGAARVALALVLWNAVFDGRAEVGGMSLKMMASYYLVAVFVFQFDQSGALAGELAAEIRTGCFGKYLARPVDPLSWFLAASAGRSAFQAGAAILAAILCAAAAAPLLAAPDPLGLLAALPVILSGLLSLALVNFMTGILAFAFQDIGAFQVAKNCLVEFLSGALLPLALMPPFAREALAFTPFPALASLPAELMLGRGLEELPISLARLAAWNMGLYAAARALYSRLSARYEEMGS